MRYVVFCQDRDSGIQGIIAIISKDRCSSAGSSVHCLYAFAISKGQGKEINLRRLSRIVRTVSTALLIMNFLRNLL